MSLDRRMLHQVMLDSIREGVYATDKSRRIIYWSKGAERITGWTAKDIRDKHCYDDVLCHVDKDGHRLCGEEYCPLHRSICTGKSSQVPIIVFALTKRGGRIPLQVSVSPLRDGRGRVVGGVETFRDLSGEFADIDRVRKIQQLSMQHDMPVDKRIRFTTRYVPRDVIGGDYYAVGRLDDHRYGFLLADVMGHGVCAALYTMCLSSLWNSCQHLLMDPVRFARAVGDRLHLMVERDVAFAAAVCGLFDLKKRVLRVVGAGNPGPLIIRSAGPWENPEVQGLFLGVMKDTEYTETVIPLKQGDCVLFFTDGAVEVANRNGKTLGVAGLMRILQEAGYPGSGPASVLADRPAGLNAGLPIGKNIFETIEDRMLRASDRIRFDDDVTFIEARVTA